MQCGRTYLEDKGTPKMPALHLVAPPGRDMDSSKAAGEALAKRVFLPALRMKPGNCKSLIR
jgi:hypothetical protein